MPTLTLTQQQARLVTLKAQNLLEPLPHKAAKADVLNAIQQMGALQIDTISVVARSPYLSLWSRLGEYDAVWLDELLQEKSLFEYWSHAASFLPIEDYPYYRSLNLSGLRTRYSQEWYEHHKEDCDRVLEYILHNGEVKSATFERQDGKKGTWWDWKIEKDALEYWFQQGVVMVSRRERFQRVYDLSQRLMPDWRDQDAPPLEETISALCEKALNALGVALPSWVADYFRLPQKQVLKHLSDLKKSGKVLEINIAGWEETALVTPQNLATAEAAAQDRLEPTYTTLLSPFDALIWDRKRTRQLFNFDYTIEVYLPQHKRIYGYYNLPILHRGKLVGRLDAKAHRQKRVFEVKALYLEPGIKPDHSLTEDLAAAIQNCANWHKTPEVVLQKTDPVGWLPDLKNYF